MGLLINFSCPKLLRLDIIMDNAGLELFTDMCLADFLISKDCIEKIVFHGKVSLIFLRKLNKTFRLFPGLFQIQLQKTLTS